MWIALENALGLGQAHVAEHLDYTLAPLRRSQRGVDLDDLVGLPANRHQRVERHHRFLENHGNAAAADSTDTGGRQRQEVLALVDDAAAGHAHVGLGQQAQDSFGHHRLARPGFTD